ncbi:MAG: hypothetical protein L6R40_004434 [Gallowayella cf. fulva]|nr:MAG: hypothetical protein L6R40_004434 [Xanthomendoza cf. fulva]
MGGGPKPEHLLVILPFEPPTAIFDRIRRNHPHIQITFHQLFFTDTPWKARSHVPPELFHDATLLLTLSALPPSPEDCPRLELIHFTSAGTNHIANSPIYTDTTIPLTTSSGIHGPQIAEWVLMTMLVSSHHYSLLHQWQKSHTWGKPDKRAQSLLRNLHDKAGQRLGVLGYGSIGRQVGNVAKALGMDVIAYTARPRTTPESKHDNGFIVPGTGDPKGEIPHTWYSGTSKADLHHFLAQDIDHLLISVPLTKETTHLLGEEEFAILSKRNAFITNISRGPIVSQPALIAALKAYDAHTSALRADDDDSFTVRPEADIKADTSIPGLRGAALDVTDPEPLPKDDPLWDAPNCIITPHISGMGSAYVDRCFRVLEVNLERREKGERLINLVDRKRGY